MVPRGQDGQSGPRPGRDLVGALGRPRHGSCGADFTLVGLKAPNNAITRAVAGAAVAGGERWAKGECVGSVLLGILELIGGAFLLLCALVFLAWSGGAVTIARDSLAWPSSPARITASGVRSNRKANGLPGHRYLVSYEFKVGGKSFKSNLFAAGDFPYGSRAWAGKRAARYSTGSTVLAYYDPRDPEIAVLEPGWNSEMLYPILVELGLCVASVSLLAHGAFVLWSLLSA